MLINSRAFWRRCAGSNSVRAIGLHEGEEELVRKCEELVSLGTSWFQRELCSHDRDYLTPLALAVMQFRRAAVQCLLKYGEPPTYTYTYTYNTLL